jgi:regulator of protease activity HflC (stomatin/prohibitin superfamily)
VINSVQIENIDFSAAYEKSVEHRMRAEASAIKSRAEALAQNQNLIELTKAEKWNGQLPTTMLPNGTLPFFNTNK